MLTRKMWLARRFTFLNKPYNFTFLHFNRPEKASNPTADLSPVHLGNRILENGLMHLYARRNFASIILMQKISYQTNSRKYSRYSPSVILFFTSHTFVSILFPNLMTFKFLWISRFPFCLRAIEMLSSLCIVCFHDISDRIY